MKSIGADGAAECFCVDDVVRLHRLADDLGRLDESSALLQSRHIREGGLEKGFGTDECKIQNREWGATHTH